MFGKNGRLFSKHWKKFGVCFPNIGNYSGGFTLVELVTVVAVLCVLVGVAIPVLRDALEAGRRAKCSSNLRQLFVANAAYAAQYGYYVAAAPDLFSGNRTRWHGQRSGGSGAFDGQGGPLSPFLGGDGCVRQCPGFHPLPPDQAANSFEASCGGYGYNDRGVGSRVYLEGYTASAMRKGMPPGAIASPAHTVMFADTGFPQPYGQPKYMIEYSFAEAYYFVGNPPEKLYGPAQPSIHFRHGGRAGVAWCDGHVSFEPRALPAGGADGDFAVGWFGPADNSLFDPY